MIHDIEAAMDRDIDSLNWMTAATKTRAKEKDVYKRQQWCRDPAPES